MPVLLFTALAALWLEDTAARPPDAAPLQIQASEAAIRHSLLEGRYAEAESLARARLEQAEAESGVASPAAADALDLLVVAMWRHGKGLDPEALGLAQRAVAIREMGAGDPDPDIATSLENLGTLLSSSADFRAARQALEKAIALREAAGDAGAPPLASCRERLATVLGNTGRYHEARSLLERALRDLSEATDQGRAEAAQILTTQGAVLTNFGDQEGARAALDRALEIRTELFGADHPEVAATLYRQAILLRKSGDLPGAGMLAERALHIRERSLAPGCPDIAATLGALADIRSDEGRPQEARHLHERALEMREAALGPHHPVVAAGLKNLGSVLGELGRYADARRVIERALAIEEDRLGPEHPQVALTLVNLGSVRAELRDLKAARSILDRAARIQERALRPGHPLYAGTMLSLATVLEELGERAEARNRLEQAGGILEKALGADDPGVVRVLASLAESHLQTREFDHARPLLERARGILEGQPGLGQARLGRVLGDLGRLQRDSGDPGGAVALFDAAQAAIAESLGPVHPLVAMALRDRALARWGAGDPEGALDDALAAENIERAVVLEFSRFLSEREALRYREAQTSGLHLALSLLAAGGPAGGASRVRLVWDEVVKSRALVLDELAFRHRAALESGSPEVSRLAGDLEAARRRLFRLMRAETAQPQREEDRRRLEAARREVESAERALAERSALFREAQARSQIGLHDVEGVLPSDVALAAFVRYQRRPAPGGSSIPGDGTVTSYLAFVAPAESAEPMAVDLGPASEIEALIRAWRAEVSAPPADLASMARYRSAGARLSRALWQPLAAHLGSAGVVLVVPDGDLNFVSLATLPVGGERYLVEQGPLVHYLSAERDLVRVAEAVGEGRGLLAVGGPDYDAPPMRQVSRPQKSEERPEASLGPTARSAPLDAGAREARDRPCRDLPAMHFDPLPSATAEAGEVAGRWKRQSTRSEGKRATRDAPEAETLWSDVSSLSGAAATEAAIKAGAPGRSVLHLATHGFFVPARCGERVEDPLLAAGLALAGANRRDEAWLRDGSEDGLLTAEEIASLDLRGVRWAVLSACDTGLGAVRAGEGVLGLRRAFKIAGVNTLIMSLWAVEDHSARDWIQSLYRYRAKGLSTVEAMSRAGRSAIADRRRAGVVTHPFYWGAFVAAGDWR